MFPGFFEQYDKRTTLCRESSAAACFIAAGALITFANMYIHNELTEAARELREAPGAGEGLAEQSIDLNPYFIPFFLGTMGFLVGGTLQFAGSGLVPWSVRRGVDASSTEHVDNSCIRLSSA